MYINGESLRYIPKTNILHVYHTPIKNAYVHTYIHTGVSLLFFGERSLRFFGSFLSLTAHNL